MSLTRQQILVWFPLCFVLYEMTCYLSGDAYLPAMTVIKHYFATSDNLVRQTMTTWFLGSACVQLLMAPATEYWGRRRVLLVGNIFFIASCILCTLVSGMHSFLVLRFIQGFCVASMAVSGYATIHSLYNEKEAIKKIALINTISIIAPAFGPLAGASILHWLSWQGIFIILAAIAATSLLFLFYMTPETISQLRQRPSMRLLLSRYIGVTSHRQVLAYNLPSRFLFAVMISWLCVGPFMVQELYHLSIHHFGIAQLIIFCGYIIGNEAVKRLVDRFALSTIIWWSWALCLLGVGIAIGTTYWCSTRFYCQLPGLTIISFGTGLSSAIFNRLAVEKSDQPMDETVAVVTLMTTLFGAFAAWLTNVFYKNTLWSFTLLSSGLTLIGFLLYLAAYLLGWLCQDSGDSHEPN